MPYDILFHDHALDRIAAAGLPPEVIDGFEERLQWLAIDPVNRSRRSGFPFPARGQMYSFHLKHAGVRYYFVVFFFYAQDEETLKIMDVTLVVEPGLQ
jgi:hypothetical protein